MPSSPLSAGWVRLSRSGRALMAGTVAVVVSAGLALAVTTSGSAVADVNSSAATDVPADDLLAINAAVGACPTLTPPRLAGQLMANSGFKPAATGPGGASGIAGLTDAAWQKWLPRPGAQRSSAQDNIVALAHQMCDFAGELRSAKVAGDPWRLALAAFAVGVQQVELAGGVPTGAAADYVAKVELYNNWYAAERQFGGPGNPSPSAAPSPSASLMALTAAKSVPDNLVNLVLAAGSVCPTITPERVAAQLMAASGFNANKLSSSGQEGIAQFLPQEWAQYDVQPLATPWDPAQAIPVLGRAMCDLAGQVSAESPQTDAYDGALTAFEWGVTSVAQAGGLPDSPNRSFIAAVAAYLPAYAADKRLNPDGPSAPPSSRNPASGSPRPASSTPPSHKTTTTTPTTTPAFVPPVPGARNVYVPIQAESFAQQSGTQIEACTDVDAGQDIGLLAPGRWLSYERASFGDTGATRVLVRFASGLSAGMTGQVEVRLDSLTNPPVGTVSVAGTGGWQSWTTVSANITRVTGVHIVYLTFTSSSGWEIGNINWFTFQN